MISKTALKLQTRDPEDMKKAERFVRGYRGVQSVSLDQNESMLKFTGKADVYDVVVGLRKLCPADIESVETEGKSKKKMKAPGRSCAIL